MTERRRLRVGDHIGFLSGFPFNSDYFHHAEGTRLIRIRDLVKADGETFYRSSFERRWLINADDILIGMDGDFNIVRWHGGDALLNQRILKVECKSEGLIDLNFFFYWCAPFLIQVHNRTAATTVKHLSVKDLEKARDLFPPKSEQKRIAEILSTMDEAIEQTEVLIAKQQQIKEGLMNDLFTRGVTPDGRLRPARTEAPHLYQNSPLGWIPKEWRVEPFSEALTSAFLGTAARGVQQSPETVPLLKMGNLTWGELNLTDVELVARFLVTDERHWLRPSDFLFNTRNTPELVGKTAVYRGEFERCTFDNNILCVRFKGGLDSRFVCQYMSHGIGKQRVFTMATGTTSVAAIYWSALAKFLLPIPKAPEESAAIADRVDFVQDRIAAETALLTKLRQQKQGLMHDLLTGKVRVPLNC